MIFFGVSLYRSYRKYYCYRKKTFAVKKLHNQFQIEGEKSKLFDLTFPCTVIYQNVLQLTHCVILTLRNPFLTKENDSFIEAVFRFLKCFSILIFNIRDLFFCFVLNK